MSKIDIVSGIAFLSGIILLAITAQILFAPIVIAVSIFFAYYTGRLTGKKETFDLVQEVVEEELRKAKKERENSRQFLTEVEQHNQKL